MKNKSNSKSSVVAKSACKEGKMTTRTDLLEALHGSISPDAIDIPLFCGFKKDPGTNQKWTPKTMEEGKFPKSLRQDNNNFMSLSKFRHDSKGRYRAKIKYIVEINAIMLDDIGTKVKKKLKLRPSCKIETSPGNFQVLYFLVTSCTDIKLFNKIMKAMAKEGWTDPGATGANRWVRFPGVNTKAKHLDDDGEPAKVRIKELHPDLRYSMEQIVEAFGLEIDEKSIGRKNSSSQKASNDPVLSAIQKKGLWKREEEPGKHDIKCPWVGSHTDNIDHGTAYYEPSQENNNQGGFKCLHGHCSGRNIADLKEYLGIPIKSQENSTIDEILLTLNEKLHVFHNENGETFGFVDGHCRPLKHKKVNAHISREIKEITGKIVRRNYLLEVLAMLDSEALIEGNELKLFNRIAFYKKRIYYDLGNGKAIKVGPKVWRIVKAPILFRRYDHQQEQVTPASGGDPWQLFKFFNIPKAHQLETLVLLISYLIPDIAHPIFHPHGAQGSGKTTLCKMIKDLIDPSSLGAAFAPKNKQELIRQINRHHLTIFDNVSKIDSEMSDILCLACTGGGMTKRALYTDDDDIIYNFKRCIGLNGINLLITKPDLLDRTMLLHLDRISPKKRKGDDEIWRDFKKAKPEILGGMFNVLVKAMTKHPKVKLKKLPRMADFAKWGYAIAEALEEGLGKQFLLDYESNIKRQNAEVIQNNSLCLAVKLLMKSETQWEGTVMSAYEALTQIINPSKGDNTFPADAKNMRKHLERIETTLLEAENIKYRYSDKAKSDGYHIEFIKTK